MSDTPSKTPWKAEADHAFWMSISGYPCIAIRHKQFGTWCGYVGIPETHPLHKVDLQTESECLKERFETLKQTPLAEMDLSLDRMMAGLFGNMKPCPAFVLTAHGGITFGGLLSRLECPSEIPPQYLPEGYWCFGFDCMHNSDIVPAYLDESYELFQITKDIKSIFKNFLFSPEENTDDQEENDKMSSLIDNLGSGLNGKSTYKDIEFVREQCEHLAEQLKSLVKAPTNEKQ